ncbi:hypothetical protein NDU88_010871 [Pleurodeles waltl]|uniref:Uncharacterized protein n=1 Tax=Pleurodeles waltl TaxID=8319 RepID=A0AAV7S2C8_PLEWA|nr:hypothetical protein NDU88_010871 [Pleurodeles waltl]
MQPGPAWVGRPLWNEGRSGCQVLGRGMLVEGRGGRVLSLPPLGSARNALERRSRSSAMAAASSRDHRVLRVGRAFRGTVLPELLIMPGSDCAVIPGALGHSRAQDFGVCCRWCPQENGWPGLTSDTEDDWVVLMSMEVAAGMLRQSS